ncbi:MAG: membrane protein insertase YidC [Pseudomonadota bacterium]
MENQRTFLIIALLAISAVLYQKWLEFSDSYGQVNGSVAQQNVATLQDAPATPVATPQAQPEDLPSTPVAVAASAPEPTPQAVSSSQASPGQVITVTTDLVIAKINTQGGVIESMELLQEPISMEQQDQGFPLLKKSAIEIFVAQDGLLVSGQKGPNHIETLYQAPRTDYQLDDQAQIEVPLSWTSPEGVQYVKLMRFTRDSYVVDIEYQVNNVAANPWQGYIYGQFSRTEPENTGGGFGQLPSYTGGAIYSEEEKYEKIDFDDMSEGTLATRTSSGWVAMLQHYFVGAWIPINGGGKQFYAAANNRQATPVYRIGYKTIEPVQILAGQSGQVSTRVYLGSKQQSRLKEIEKTSDIKGLALTVDYGFLTFIADPLFWLLDKIHSVVGNWGWAIILLTILIKLVFYPLSAASYKSMAGMKKLQPRMQTLKERYKDDRQKFQMEMMALYKKEKINPAGGCLPILVQIPVFIALYWVLLESVEIRQAPFALWLQDLSAPDPYFILPILMGASMWAQQKLNPAPMDDIQKKVMTIMPIALTFLFLTFPQGLVLYWVVNNVLSMAQQWVINRKYAN